LVPRDLANRTVNPRQAIFIGHAALQSIQGATDVAERSYSLVKIPYASIGVIRGRTTPFIAKKVVCILSEILFCDRRSATMDRIEPLPFYFTHRRHFLLGIGIGTPIAGDNYLNIK
jgi:hypothetical protein